MTALKVLGYEIDIRGNCLVSSFVMVVCCLFT